MTDHLVLTNQTALITALAADLSTQWPGFAIFETHISWVLVAGDHAYKFKKAVRFDFLDFSTLETRRFFCEEEIRLNKRLAPDIYLDVVPVSLRGGKPVLGGDGVPVEYAVRMYAFEQQALWDHRLHHDLLRKEEIDALAELLARFHQTAAVAPPSSPWASQEALNTVANETLHHLAASVQDEPNKEIVRAMLQWDARQRMDLAQAFAERKSRGMIRECHGDLHGRNILTRDGKVEAFDCIEFNDQLRWIDVMNDIAFVIMDLRFQGRADFAARFLNGYLAATGDYRGLAVLRYYEVHRALIRCKVALLRAEQKDAGSDEVLACRRQAHEYLAFSLRRIRPVNGAIIITHGFSGCGKSTIARGLVESLDAIQLRSDVERKRLQGLAPLQRGEAMLYAPAVTEQTYNHLAETAAQVVRSGNHVIVDATFLKRSQRQRFRELAQALGVPFLIVDVQAPEAVMRTRIVERERLAKDASDAGLAVLASQLAGHEPLSEEEIRQTVVIQSEAYPDSLFIERIRARLTPGTDAGKPLPHTPP